VRGYWDAKWAVAYGWDEHFRSSQRTSLRQANQLESARDRAERRSLAFRRSISAHGHS
jgi:hypothetical protein